MDSEQAMKRIDEWIGTLEQKARLLLDGLEIDAEEMTPKERIDSAAKLVTLAQRYMVIRRQSEAGEPPTRNTILLTLMKQMRGELTEPLPGDTQLLTGE